MGLLYNIYQSLQEQVEHNEELMVSSGTKEKEEVEYTEQPKSLVELLSEPIGRKSKGILL